MRSRCFLWNFLIVALGLALSFVPLQAASAASDEVVIGVPLPTSGYMTYYGSQQLQATQMAVEDINKAGGIKGRKLRIIHYDTASKPQEAITAVRKLIEHDKVLALAGPLLSSSTRVAFPVANRAGVPIVSSASSAPGIAADNRPWSFRNTALEADTARPALEYWVKHFKLKRVAIIVDTKDFVSKSYGTEVVPALLKEFGVEIADTVSLQSGDVDFSAQVTRVKQINPEGIVLAALYNEAAGIAREVRRQGMTQPFYGGNPLAGPGYVERGGKAVEGTIVASGFWADDPKPEIAAWVKRFKDLSPQHSAPHEVALYQYQTMWIFKHCIESTGATLDAKDIKSDREKIRDCWAGLKDFAVLGGTMSINKDGDAKRDANILTIKDAKFIKLN
ncbi:MAG: ABC transporter substrate-binding protein [Candidatus Tectomicrobia bacterium]|nr:ABC transporter substrate-binding protein [Candidatus Tectomicrobia bacterium]